MLTVSAIAVAHRRANAVGAVRLSCGSDGLFVDLLRVRRFAAGFAFVGTAKAVSFKVPYRAVRALTRESHVLHLVLDPKAVAPYNRFALARFSSDTHATLLRSLSIRTAVAALRWVLPPLLAALAIVSLPEALAAGVVGRGAFAALIGGFSFHLLTVLSRWLNAGGPLSERLKARFERALTQKLGLESTDPDAPMLPSMLEPSLDGTRSTVGHALSGGILRPRAFAAVALLSIIASMATALAVQRYGTARRVELPVPRALHGVATQSRQLAEQLLQEVTPRRKACECKRVDSPLWNYGVGQLSVLLSPRRGDVDTTWASPGETYAIREAALPPAPGTHTDPGALTEFDNSVRDDPSNERAPQADDTTEPARAPVSFEMDLAVVNNGSTTLDTVDLVVTFARRDAQNRRRAITERGLHWPGQLAPGRAVKWRVRASGTELRVDTRIAADLGQPVPVAEADVFYALREARLDAVRVHAAMMLAYLGDDRARDVLATLEDVDSRLRPARDSVQLTFAPLVACDRRELGPVIHACVVNRTRELLRAVTVMETGVRSDGAPPARWRIEDMFLAQTGLMVRIDVASMPEGLLVIP